MTELSLTHALLSGLFMGTLLIVLGIFEDHRLTHSPHQHFGLTITTAAGLFLGAKAFIHAWTWAGMADPVHRLASRACGMALGYGVPAVVSSHALYFQWAIHIDTAFDNGIQQLVRAAMQLASR